MDKVGTDFDIILNDKNIKNDYNKNEEILKGIDFAVKEGTFTAILGHSGSGKSTLLNILSGMLKPSSGCVEFKGINVTKLKAGDLEDWVRNNVGIIFQNYLLLSNLTVKENIEIGLLPNAQSIPFNDLVNLLGIEQLLDKFPAQLSGGQQQRVAIARAVIKMPKLLFCDEATGCLDEKNSKAVVDLLHKIKRDFGVAILFTTHNFQIAETADRVITIKDGLMHNDQINKNPISAYDMVWG